MGEHREPAAIGCSRPLGLGAVPVQLDAVAVGVPPVERLADVEYLAREWRRDYDTKRPHSSLGYLTPSAFAASLSAEAVA